MKDWAKVLFPVRFRLAGGFEFCTFPGARAFAEQRGLTQIQDLQRNRTIYLVEDEAIRHAVVVLTLDPLDLYPDMNARYKADFRAIQLGVHTLRNLGGTKLAECVQQARVVWLKEFVDGCINPRKVPTSAV